MAEGGRPQRKTASRRALETERCNHMFEIDGYRTHKHLVPAYEPVESATFAIGGQDWCVLFYPNGSDVGYEDTAGVFLELVSETTESHRVHFDFRLVDPSTGLSSSVFDDARVFNSEAASWGTRNFMETSLMESLYVRKDRLVIECDVTVINRMAVSNSETICDIQVPNLGNLLEWEEGADVTLEVRGEVFHAHKILLAMRSPVFKAELYGPMKETKTITIQDLQPAVFKALLHFIYKDSLPAMDDLDADENEEMVKHLLVAADRYAMERLKVICESILAKNLDAESVAITLVLADQHHCSQLKDACIGFINSLNRVDDVVSSQGYEHLKRACPSCHCGNMGKIHPVSQDLGC